MTCLGGREITSSSTGGTVRRSGEYLYIKRNVSIDVRIEDLEVRQKISLHVRVTHRTM